MCTYEISTEFYNLEPAFLPDYESFYSNLKKKNVLETEYSSLGDEDKIPLSTDPNMDTKTVNSWKKPGADRGFKAMLDYLKYYNFLGVETCRWNVEVREHDIDLSKQVLTLSSSANQILHIFNKSEAVFVFTEKKRFVWIGATENRRKTNFGSQET